MIYQPRNVQPSSISIDADINNIFSMEMQTNSYVSAYRLYISDFNNNNIYEGPKVSTSPLYNGDILYISVDAISSGLTNGLNYKWKVRLYQNTPDMIITYGNIKGGSDNQLYVQPNINIKNGMFININGQNKFITNYNNDNGLITIQDAFPFEPEIGQKYYIYSDFIDTTPDYIFYARKTPEVSIEEFTSETPLTTLEYKYAEFHGVYEQQNNVPIVYYQFNLYVLNSDGSRSLLDSTGKIYSARLEYSYDRFRTDNTYYIEMIVENDMGITSQTELYSFDVSYSIIEYLQQPTATLDSVHNAINISWAAPIEHDGNSYYINGSGKALPVFLYDTPYNGVNSLHTNGYTTEWESNDGLCVMPDEQNITFQFSPDEKFFYDINNHYQESANIIEAETEDEDEGAFTISIDKNKLIFEQDPDIHLESYFYINNETFVLTSTGTKQINADYIWDDDEVWDDDFIWTEGGTSLERICNHWWKVQINGETIKIEEIFPNI